MDEERKRFLQKRTDQMLEKRPYLKPLLKRLLSLGGEAVVLWNDNNGPYGVAHLIEQGSLFNKQGLEVIKGEPSRCHENVFALWANKPDDYLIVTGYGLSDDGIWRPHSWCVDRKTGKIIETTERREEYFGVEFSEHEIADWAEGESLTDASDGRSVRVPKENGRKNQVQWHED